MSGILLSLFHLFLRVFYPLVSSFLLKVGTMEAALRRQQRLATCKTPEIEKNAEMFADESVRFNLI